MRYSALLGTKNSQMCPLESKTCENAILGTLTTQKCPLGSKNVCVCVTLRAKIFAQMPP